MIMDDVIKGLTDKWNKNASANSEFINKIENEFKRELPGDYLNFLRWSDGGEGRLKNGYLYLWKLEDLPQLNLDYGIQEFLLKDCIAIGTDGGDVCYGFDYSKGRSIFKSPLGDLDYNEITYVGKTFLDFIKYLNNGNTDM
jgi:hypothetical protein